jgi:hypothetical protein
MLLNVDLIVQMMPFRHPWGFGFSPFLLFFGVLILFAVLRGSGGRNRRPPGYYRSQPPHYHQGSPYQRQEQDPESGDLPSGEQYPGGPSRYDPRAWQDSASRGGPYTPPYGNYETPNPPTDPGEPTVRVYSQANEQGQPTVRVVPPAATMRVDSAETAGYPTTPLGSTPRTPPANASIEPGDVDPAEGNNG